MNKRFFKVSRALGETLLVIAAALVLVGCSRTEKKPAAQTALDTTLAQQNALTSAPVIPLTYEQRQGKYFYDRYCAVCHGEKGAGDGFNSFNLDPKPHSFADSAYFAAISDASLEQVISAGGRGVNKSVLMPSYGATLNKRDISYVVAYLRTLARSISSPQ